MPGLLAVHMRNYIAASRHIQIIVGLKFQMCKSKFFKLLEEKFSDYLHEEKGHIKQKKKKH